MREFLLFFTLQFASYLNITVDMRAVAHQQYAIAMLTNACAPMIAWIMVRHIGKAKHPIVGLVAVGLGGSLAALAGMWLTRAWR